MVTDFLSYLHQTFYNLYDHVDDGVNFQRAGHQQVQERGYGDSSTEYLVRGIQGSDESSWHLGQQIAPEEGRVKGALRSNCPVEPESVVVIVFGGILHGHLGHAHVTPHTERDHKSWK